MQLYQEYLGGGGVSQQKIFGSSLEEIRTNAIKAGINPVNLQQAQQFQDGSWTPFASGTSATYKGSEGIAEQSFVGTNQEITQQATAAGINPSNLFTGLDKFVPEADDNIDISQGSSSVLQGGQSNWFKTFQDSYVSGQATVQQSIAKLLQQQADITQETREGYQDTIDEATTGLEEAKDKPYGEELGEELSEKYKLQEKIDKLGEIGNQLAQLQGAYDASVAQTEMSGITIGQSRGELARKQREYASKATVLQAQGAVITEQYNLVSDIVEKYYNSAESERTAEISRYQNLLDVATRAKLALNTDDKNQITTQINLLLGEQAKQEANKDKIMALAIDPNTAEAFFNSGASLDDTYEQILEKMSPFMSAFAKAERLSGVGGGITGVEKTEIDILAEMYNNGESLGSIGATKKAQVVARAKELKAEQEIVAQEEQVNVLESDPKLIADIINEAELSGQSLRESTKELESLGISKEKIKEALRVRIETLGKRSFFQKLFGIK